MNIGEAAAASGVNAKMIRHYEDIGLLPRPARAENRYRRYGARDVHELRFIGRARALGFSTADISALLALWRDRGRPSRDVRRLAERHLDDMRRRIANLEDMARNLETLVAHCHGDGRPDCPILDELAGVGG
ncbi:MAG: Cu(I)-responsive transcriptional regulator [Hyphomicrobiales bacterium]|nr:Cu(I)-responsive transcriptional regulator [Hyphomicrobiales bacterium]MDE2017159.1 Cu(I)-responsive transcriptional regulator [Hyphomicrobiales bacterium]